jgi:hypothetical protein
MKLYVRLFGSPQRARGAPETLSNGEHSLEFTNYEQTTNPFWSPP